MIKKERVLAILRSGLEKIFAPYVVEDILRRFNSQAAWEEALEDSNDLAADIDNLSIVRVLKNDIFLDWGYTNEGSAWWRSILHICKQREKWID